MNTETSGLLSLNSQATCTEKFVRDDRYVGVCASELWNYCSGLILILFTTLEGVSLASTVLGWKFTRVDGLDSQRRKGCLCFGPHHVTVTTPWRQQNSNENHPALPPLDRHSGLNACEMRASPSVEFLNTLEELIILARLRAARNSCPLDSLFSIGGITKSRSRQDTKQASESITSNHQRGEDCFRKAVPKKNNSKIVRAFWSTAEVRILVYRKTWNNNSSKLSWWLPSLFLQRHSIGMRIVLLLG